MLDSKTIHAASKMLGERVPGPEFIPDFCREEGIDPDMISEVAAAVSARLIAQLDMEVPIGDDGIDTDDPAGEKVHEVAQAVVQTFLLGLVAGMRGTSEQALPDIDNLTDEHDG